MSFSAVSELPRFALVGHPNKGKSSIVATLAQDDSIYIDRLSGSTTKAHSYPMQVDGVTLYELIDTPGFQRARAVLSWLESHCRDVSQRPSAVEEFVTQHQNDARFYNEIELLTPIIRGAGIIYVVDGSRPYGPEYNTEMEILRWTGKPSLALINPIDNDDYVKDWQNALGQYFKTVRVFNAQQAEYTKRIGLLAVFGQLDPHWQAPLEQAAAILKQWRQQQHQFAAEIIADLLVDSLQHCEKLSFPSSNDQSQQSGDALRTMLAGKFQQHLRQLEKNNRRKVAEIFHYYKLRTDENAMDYRDRDFNQDLFDQNTWYLFGLSKKQLVTTAVAAGASAGVVIDIGTGGHSLLLGSLIGGVTGGLGAWKFSDRIGKFTIKGLPTGGLSYQYGPITNINFPFVVLGRALLHHRLVCQRTHAARDILNVQPTLESNDSALDGFSQKNKTKLMKIFKEIQQFKKVLSNREALCAIIVERLMQVDQ